MKTKAILTILAAALVFSSSVGCGKSDEELAVERAREWAIHNFSEGVTPPPQPKALPEDLVIVVPESVKAKYKTAIMAIGDRKTKEITKFKVAFGEKAEVPVVGYTIKLGDYLPQWVISGSSVTTKGDEPVDPAVRATIYDKDGAQIFDGFIFQHHKTPSFITEKYVIGLIGAE